MSNDIEKRTKEDDVFGTIVAAFAEMGKQAMGDEERFCIDYLDVWNQLDAREAKIKEMAAAMIRELETSRRALQYRLGTEFRHNVTAAVAKQRGNARSVKYLTGKAGFRRGEEHIEFTDVEAAKKWMIEDSGWTFEQIFAAVSGLAKTDHAVRCLWTELITVAFAKAITGLNKTPFHDAIKADGAEIPGVELVPAENKLFPWIKDQEALPMAEPKAELGGAS